MSEDLIIHLFDTSLPVNVTIKQDTNPGIGLIRGLCKKVHIPLAINKSINE